jgi:hypothetical protein
MKLLYSKTSPYVRKVLVAAQELDLLHRIELVPAVVAPTSRNPEVTVANPLGKIPTLILEDGTALYDSRVIIVYLDSLTDTQLAPSDGIARFKALTGLAAADGIVDAALVCRYELATRPEPLRWADWVEGQWAKVTGALDMFETTDLRADDDWSIVDIALACALGYLDFRFADRDWRPGRPRLSAFYAQASQRASMQATVPS